MCTSDQIRSMLSWRIHSIACGNDHFPRIIFVPCLPQNTYSRPPPRMKYRLLRDWSVFSQQSEIYSLPRICQGNEAVGSDTLTKTIVEVADEIFLIKEIRYNKIQFSPWWDNECIAAIKQRKEAGIK